MNVTEIVIILTIFLAVVSVLIALPIRAAYKERERLNSIDLSKEIRGWRNKQVEDADRKSQTLGDA